jgi:hypothetical protein
MSLAPEDELVTLFRGVARMRTCPQCGKEIDGWDGVCGHCADAATAAERSTPAAPLLPSTAKHLAYDDSAVAAQVMAAAQEPLPTPVLEAAVQIPAPPVAIAEPHTAAPGAPAAAAARKAPVTPAAKKPTSKSWQLGALVTAVLVIGAVTIMLSWPRADAVPPSVVQAPPRPAAVPKPATPARPAAPPQAAPATAAPVVNATSPAAPEPAAAAPPPKWVQSPQPKWATDRYKTITYELEAENEVAVWMKRVRPTLAVRCLSRQTEVFVVTDTSSSFEQNADRHTVHLGFDDREALTEQWSDSADHRELFAPDGAALAEQIAGAKRLVFTFTPFNASAVKVEFDVRGFAGPLQSIAKTCGVSKRGHA